MLETTPYHPRLWRRVWIGLSQHSQVLRRGVRTPRLTVKEGSLESHSYSGKYLSGNDLTQGNSRKALVKRSRWVIRIARFLGACLTLCAEPTFACLPCLSPC